MTKKRTSHETRAAKPRALASGIPVWCLHDKIVSADSLKPFPGGNYRIHKATQLDRFGDVIRGSGKKPGNGWRRSIVVSPEGYIVRGHGAWQWAKREQLYVPVERQSYASRAEQIRDLVADNRLAELAENDDDALRKLLGELDADDLPLRRHQRRRTPPAAGASSNASKPRAEPRPATSASASNRPAHPSENSAHPLGKNLPP